MNNTLFSGYAHVDIPATQLRPEHKVSIDNRTGKESEAIVFPLGAGAPLRGTYGQIINLFDYRPLTVKRYHVLNRDILNGIHSALVDLAKAVNRIAHCRIVEKTTEKGVFYVAVLNESSSRDTDHILSVRYEKPPFIGVPDNTIWFTQSTSYNADGEAHFQLNMWLKTRESAP